MSNDEADEKQSARFCACVIYMCSHLRMQQSFLTCHVGAQVKAISDSGCYSHAIWWWKQIKKMTLDSQPHQVSWLAHCCLLNALCKLPRHWLVECHESCEVDTMLYMFYDLLCV